MPIVKQSRFPFAETTARLMHAIVETGNTVFATFDQAAAAEHAGLTLRPTFLIVFGNPKGGTVLMEGFPLVALDLPLKMLVWKEDDDVHVAYIAMSELAARHRVCGEDSLIAAIDASLEALSDSVT